MSATIPGPADAGHNPYGKPDDFRARLDGSDAYTDDGLARDIAGLLEATVRTAPKSGEVLVWDGCRWRPDDTEAVSAHIRHHLDLRAETLRRIAEEAGNEEKEGVRKWAREARGRLLSSAGIGAVTGLVLKDPRLTLTAESLDADPYILATPTGYIDLRTSKVTAPDPGALVTRMTGVGYYPDATAPRWDRFLEEVTDGDPALALYLQKLLGYSLTGLYSQQRLYFLYGKGANGKDTLLEVVAAAAGDYAGMGVEGMLLQRTHDRHMAEVYMLRGRRLVVHSESDQGKRLDMGRVKSFTGSPQVTANAMRQDPVTFPNTWTHLYMTNHLPAIDTDDFAMARRLVVIPFPVTFYRADDTDAPPGAARREEGLGPRLIETELAGVLRWLVEGARLFFADPEAERLDMVEVVRAETADYLTKNADRHGIHAWTEDRTYTDDPTATTPVADLYDDYLTWARGHNRPAAGQTLFGTRLTSAGHPGGSGRAEGAVFRVRRGIRLKPWTVPSMGVLMTMTVGA